MYMLALLARLLVRTYSLGILHHFCTALGPHNNDMTTAKSDMARRLHVPHCSESRHRSRASELYFHYYIALVTTTQARKIVSGPCRNPRAPHQVHPSGNRSRGVLVCTGAGTVKVRCTTITFNCLAAEAPDGPKALAIPFGGSYVK